MNRRYLLIALLLLCGMASKAQEGKESVLQPDTTFSMPPLTYRGTIAHYPYWSSLYSAFSDWSLHPGLNASLSASAIFGVGKHASSGFANSAAFMYAGNLMPKLSFALGGYSSYLDYGSRQMKDAGLTAMLNYRFDEHWEASVFVQKSMMQPKMPPQMWWMNDIGDKVGASVRYNFNPNLSVHLSVWEGRQPYYSWY